MSSFVRPEVSALFSRYSEVIGAGVAALFGLWVAYRGGMFFAGLGAVIVALALGFAVVAVRRVRFWHGVDAPGVVEVDEGKIAYMGPVFGGFVGLSELVELQVLDLAGRRRCWRLKQADGQALLIPFAAEGAPKLYDALAALPGLDTKALNRAAKIPAEAPVTLWKRD